MLAQTLAAGDKFRTEELHSLPSGTMVRSLGNLGWWEVTEVPQVETVSERDQLAMELQEAWFRANPINVPLSIPPSDRWCAVADYVLANFTPAETAVAEGADAQGCDAQVVDYPERIRDCDGDLWKLSSSGRYSLSGGTLVGGINTTDIHLVDLVVNVGPISAE